MSKKKKKKKLQEEPEPIDVARTIIKEAITNYKSTVCNFVDFVQESGDSVKQNGNQIEPINFDNIHIAVLLISSDGKEYLFSNYGCNTRYLKKLYRYFKVRFDESKELPKKAPVVITELFKRDNDQKLLSEDKRGIYINGTHFKVIAGCIGFSKKVHYSMIKGILKYIYPLSGLLWELQDEPFKKMD